MKSTLGSPAGLWVPWGQLCYTQPSALSLLGWKKASRAGTALLPETPNPVCVEHVFVLEALPALVPSPCLPAAVPKAFISIGRDCGDVRPSWLGAGHWYALTVFSEQEGERTRLSVGMQLEVGK